MKGSVAFGRSLLRTRHFFAEVVVRIVLAFLFVYLENVKAFERKIHPEELWLYKNPVTRSYIPTQLLWPIVIVVPPVVFLAFFLFRREIQDLIHSLLSWSLCLGLNGSLTTIVKVVVGRPRPDFFWRCFPDGISNPEMNCTGNPAIVQEGRRSFPSGHSSFAFASLGFISLYLAGKLGVFNEKGRGKSIRLIIAVLPSVAALAIALSRTADYHHHWQDVLCGSILGLALAYLCYRQHYPALESAASDAPLKTNYSDASSTLELPLKLV